MTDFAQPAEIRPSPSPTRSKHPPSVPYHLGEWLEIQRGFLAKYWFEEILHRVSMDQEVERVLERFLDVLTRMIPGALDHRRSGVDSVWKSAAELYGAFGAKRGLAAGDIVEEQKVARHQRPSLLPETRIVGAAIGPSMAMGASSVVLMRTT